MATIFRRTRFALRKFTYIVVDVFPTHQLSLLYRNKALCSIMINRQLKNYSCTAGLIQVDVVHTQLRQRK